MLKGFKSAAPFNLCNFSSDRRFVQNVSGAAAVEFALITPVFLFMLLGMLGFGIYLSATHSVRQLTADAARASIPGLSESERQLLAVSFIESQSERYAFIDADRLSIEVRDNEELPDRFDIEVIYDASDLPIWGLGGGAPILPSQTIVSRMTIQNGGV